MRLTSSDTDGCAMCSARAAAVNDPSRAAARKTLSWMSVIGRVYEAVAPYRSGLRSVKACVRWSLHQGYIDKHMLWGLPIPANE